MSSNDPQQQSRSSQQPPQQQEQTPLHAQGNMATQFPWLFRSQRVGPGHQDESRLPESQRQTQLVAPALEATSGAHDWFDPSAGGAAYPSAQEERSLVALGQGTVRVNNITYTQLEMIGKGGSSEVFRVTEPNNGNRVWAMKRVSLPDDKPALAQSMIQETHLLRRLWDEGCHAAVHLQDFELDLKSATLTMVMELGEMDLGTALKMRAGERVDLLFVRYHWRMLLECVKAIHDCKVLHLDLKPANFILVKSRVKLIDFGIAKPMGDDSTRATFALQIGTLDYMSPEAVAMDSRKSSDGKVRMSRKADVWSLGCILYEMIYGSPPFAQFRSWIEKMNCIANPRDFTIEYWLLKATHLPSSPLARVSPSEFERRGYTGKFEHDSIHWVPLGSVLDVMHKCLARDLDQRADIESLLAHPFVNPDEANQHFGFRLP